MSSYTTDYHTAGQVTRGPLPKHADEFHGHNVHPKNPDPKEHIHETNLWGQKSGSRAPSGEGKGANGKAQWDFLGAGRVVSVELDDGCSNVFSL